MSTFNDIKKKLIGVSLYNLTCVYIYMPIGTVISVIHIHL